MKKIDGNDIQYSVHEDLIKENFSVIAGSLQIVESLKKVMH
jgi:hypothetical protein